MQARFIRLVWENDAKTIATVHCMPDRPYYFTAGQYADITIPHDHPDSRGTTRTMTFSSAPTDKLLAFTTRYGAHGNSTYKQRLLALPPNTPMTLTDAMGDMVLPLDAAVPLVFVAGGIGIASYVSMVRWLRSQQDTRNITLLYAVRDVRDIVFQPVFDEYAAIGTMRKVLYTTDNKAAPLGWNGTVMASRLTSAHINAAALPEAQIYISGAEAMVEQLRTELQRDFGIEHYRIAYDYFDGYTEL